MRQRIGVSLTDTSGNIREITYKAEGMVLRGWALSIRGLC
jgi:hypothetical protein